MSSLLADFADAVQRHPDRIAIVDGKGRATSYAALQKRADAFAARWQEKGIGAGDRVLLAMGVDADLYAALAALWSLGATVVLPEPAMGLAGLRHAARVCKVQAFCSSGAYGLLRLILPELWGLRHLRPAAGTAKPRKHTNVETDIALISFTSGSTGAPKAIPRNHGFLLAQHAAIAPMLHSKNVERDLIAFPVFVLINIAAGRTSILPNWKMSRLAKLHPDDLRKWIEDQAATRALLPPSLCEKLTRTALPGTLHHLFTGGGPVFPVVLSRLQDRAPNLQITAVYGSTEAEPIAHLDASLIATADLRDMTMGSGLLVGKPVLQVSVRIVDDEIQVAGDHVNGGYLDPTQDAENKVHDGETIWHRTGDAGYLDGTGRLWLLGRVGTAVQIGENPTYPFCVEVAARQWDGVHQCALIADHQGAKLIIEGDAKQLDVWQSKAADLGISDVAWIKKMPMDKRHASKVDRRALATG